MSNRSLPPEVEFSEKVSFKDIVKASESQGKKPLPLWRFIVPLMIQTGLIMAVPTQLVYTNVAGRNVILQTTSFNPYDLQQGNSMRMRYDISRVETLRRLPGWSEVVRRNRGSNRNDILEPGTSLYVVMQEQRFVRNSVPRAWRPVRVFDSLPNRLAANQIPLRGTYQNRVVDYGLETYYVLEEQRQQMNRDMTQWLSRRNNRRRQQQQPVVMEVRVDPQGQAVPVSMWVQN
ncbi:MAG: GDYXXLXY domain-containing protein, partial [Calothrix sp. SM1_7_51]|nr:GDYXXLXY domain-containing protein [Calothrix sp. SM1_7_51]